MDERKVLSRHITASSDGYLSLPLAAAYLWRSRRGLRGRLSQIVYYRPDGRQIVFKKSDSEAHRERFRVDPQILRREEVGGEEETVEVMW